LQWAFEFKARSASYNVTEAIRDLNSKISTYHRVEKKQGRTPECHAMLVGITGAGPTQALVWLEEGTEQLRIVLLVNCKA
jgi:hypothetical protein